MGAWKVWLEPDCLLMYEIVELSIPQRVTTRHVNRLFDLTLPRSSVAEQKRMAANLYKETREILLLAKPDDHFRVFDFGTDRKRNAGSC
jgi:hypothetical protein